MASNKEAVKKYQEGRDAIMLRPDKNLGSTIRAAAASAGQSVQAYVLQAIDERMQRDAAIARDNAVAQDMTAEFGIPVEELEAAVAFARAVDTIEERIPGARWAILSDGFKEFIHSTGGGGEAPGVGGSSPQK